MTVFLIYQQQVAGRRNHKKKALQWHPSREESAKFGARGEIYLLWFDSLEYFKFAVAMYIKSLSFSLSSILMLFSTNEICFYLHLTFLFYASAQINVPV